VLVAGFPAGAFAANCYIVAPAPGEECVIIDPGQDAQPGIEEVLAEHRLRPAAVLLTHGHIDHVWSVAPVCGAKGIPAYIHPDDRALLSDPAKGFPLGAGQQLFGGLEFTEPDDVKELADGMTLSLVGLEIVVNHAPGHTEGSVAFRLPLGPPIAHKVKAKSVPRKRRTPRRAPPTAYCSLATCCSPGSIGRTTCPAGIPHDPAQPGAGLPDPAGRDRRAVRARAADDHRRRTPDQSVPDGPDAGVGTPRGL
jgi:Zn-dependent hydrolases, including glyoxylases